MCGTNDQIPVRGVPCAVGHYSHRHSAGGELKVPTRYDSEAGFLDWVESRRQQSPDLEFDELIMCPMLWCREPFNSISATVDHVKTCPRLQDGWYWCPFCRRPERFLECDRSCEVSQRPMIRRKGSTSSRAASFFNFLGRRNAPGEAFTDQANLQTERPMCGDFEAVARELDLAGIHEMRGLSAYEFAGFPAVSFASASGDETNGTSEVYDWLIPEPSTEIPGSGIIFTSQPKVDSGPVSAISTRENVMARWRSRNPPESLIIPNYQQLRDNKPLMARTSLSTVSSSSNFWSPDAFSLSSTEQWLSDWVNKEENINYDDPLHASCGGLSNHNSGSTRTQVNEHRDLVKVVNNEWMQRLMLAPNLRDRCAAFSSRELFAKGLETLQKCLCNNIPREFVEVFALMHLAFAAAYILHRDDGSYCWSTFFHDALDWRLSLSDQNDQDAFLGVMELWWQAELPLDTSPMTNVGPAFGSVEIQQDVVEWFSVRGMDMLRKGEIIGNCVEFLNGYREVAIIERNSQSLSGALLSNAQNRAPVIEHMIETITKPLQKQRGIEAFCDQVNDIEMQLRNGLLQNPRDVEVSLLLGGKRMSRSSVIYEKYCDLVTTLCDRAMKPSNPTRIGETWFCDDTWRNHFYIDELQEVLAVSRELDRSQGISSSMNHSSNASVLAVIRPNAIPSVSPTSPTSSTKRTSTDSSWTSLTNTPISPFSPSFPISNSATNTPITPFSPSFPISNAETNTSISPSSPSFPIPEAETTYCTTCPATFTGKIQNRRSNYTRHMRTTLEHNAHAAYKCRVSGCNAPFMRTDNLAKHMKTQHNISTQLDTQDHIKRSRRAAIVTRTDSHNSLQLLR